jgi:hypothetical protein
MPQVALALQLSNDIRDAVQIISPRFASLIATKISRSLCRRWHALEVGDIFWRFVPRSTIFRVDDGLRGKPIILVETSHSYGDRIFVRRRSRRWIALQK